MSLKINDLSNYIEQTFPGVNTIDAWGETSFFYNPDSFLKRGVYFCTIKEKDGENDKASNLNRADVFRLNFAISKEKFIQLFGPIPKRPSKGCVIEGSYDFTQGDFLMPHPVYGWMSWVAILNPSETSWSLLKDLLDEGYESVVDKYAEK